MRKKLSIFLLAILIIPAFALLGCETPQKFAISATCSDSTLGSVEGSGSFVDGNEVKLTATAKSTSAFVAWVFDGKIIAQNDIYTIEQTKSGETTTSSTLKFNAKENTKGNYTAIFKDSKTLYVSPTSWMLSTTTDATPEADSLAKEVLAQLRLTFSQGTSVLTEVYDSTAIDVKENVEIEIDTPYVLKLDVNQKIKADILMGTSPRTFRGEIEYHKNSSKTEDDYSYKVTYADGTYKLEFSFEAVVGGEAKTLYLTIIYKNL